MLKKSTENHQRQGRKKHWMSLQGKSHTFVWFNRGFLCLFLCAYCYFLRLRLQASWKYVFIYKIHTTRMVDVLRFYCNGHKDGNLLITHTILYLLQLNWIEEATDNVLSFSLSLRRCEHFFCNFLWFFFLHSNLAPEPQSNCEFFHMNACIPEQ